MYSKFVLPNQTVFSQNTKNDDLWHSIIVNSAIKPPLLKHTQDFNEATVLKVAMIDDFIVSYPWGDAKLFPCSFWNHKPLSPEDFMQYEVQKFSFSSCRLWNQNPQSKDFSLPIKVQSWLVRSTITHYGCLFDFLEGAAFVLGPWYSNYVHDPNCIQDVNYYVTVTILLSSLFC